MKNVVIWYYVDNTPLSNFIYLFIYSWFIHLCWQNSLEWSDDNNELKMTWTELSLAEFGVLSWILLGGTEKKYVNPISVEIQVGNPSRSKERYWSDQPTQIVLFDAIYRVLLCELHDFVIQHSMRHSLLQSCMYFAAGVFRYNSHVTSIVCSVNCIWSAANISAVRLITT